MRAVSCGASPATAGFPPGAPFHPASAFSSCGTIVPAVTSPATTSVAFDGRYCAAWNALRSAAVIALSDAAVPVGAVP